jgi:hypothetical protein
LVPEAYEWLWIARRATTPVHGETSLRRNREPNLGYFRLSLAPQSLMKPTLRSFDKFTPHAVGSRFTLSGAVLLCRYAYKSSSILAGDYQADCYKLYLSCILTSVLDKGEPAAR